MVAVGSMRTLCAETDFELGLAGVLVRQQEGGRGCQQGDGDEGKGRLAAMSEQDVQNVTRREGGPLTRSTGRRLGIGSVGSGGHGGL